MVRSGEHWLGVVRSGEHWLGVVRSSEHWLGVVRSSDDMSFGEIAHSFSCVYA